MRMDFPHLHLSTSDSDSDLKLAQYPHWGPNILIKSPGATSGKCTISLIINQVIRQTNAGSHFDHVETPIDAVFFDLILSAPGNRNLWFKRGIILVGAR